MLKMERCEFCERDDEEEDMDAKLSMRKKGVGDFWASEGIIKYCVLILWLWRILYHCVNKCN